MSSIPGEPLASKPPKLTMKDGRKVTLKVPGLPAPVEPTATEERESPEPPRDDFQPLHDPDHSPMPPSRP